jgi:acyl-CoA thioesterase
MNQDAGEIARLSARAMWKEDEASRTLGLMLEKVGPGQATMSMTVDVRMVNGHGSCHGGFIFALPDSTFGFACNSRGDRHVAQSCQITYLAPARLGAKPSPRRTSAIARAARASTT